MSTVGDILSTVGGYLEYRGGVQYRGGYHPLNLSTVGVFSTVGYSNNKRFSFHGTHESPRAS